MRSYQTSDVTPLFQSGGAIPGYSGRQWQTGGGWNFGRFMSRYAKPLLGYLARKTFATTLDFGKDLVENKHQSPKELAKNHLKRVGRDLANDALSKIKEKVDQIGSGRRKKRARNHPKMKRVGKTKLKSKSNSKRPKVNKKRRIKGLKSKRMKKVKSKRSRRRKPKQLSDIFE